MSRVATMSLASALAAAACGHAPVDTSTMPAASAGATASARLSVAVSFYVQRGGRRVEVAPHDVVHSGELLELEVTPSRDAFIYVVHELPDHQREILLPEQGEQLFVAGGTIHLPSAASGDELVFDDSPGAEAFEIIATVRPISAQDAAAAGLVFVGDVAAPPARVDAPSPPVASPPAASPSLVVAAPPPQAQQAAPPPPIKRRVAIAQAPTSALSAPTAGRAKGVVRRQRHVVIDGNRDDVVVFDFQLDHRR